MLDEVLLELESERELNEPPAITVRRIIDERNRCKKQCSLWWIVGLIFGFLVGFGLGLWVA